MGQRQATLSFDTSIFEAIENYIKWCQLVPRKMPGAMDMLCRQLSYAHLAFAQADSLGPVDPRQEHPELAWQRPVRRISGRFFFGWKARRITRGLWESYNDSREAFFIEFGIHRNPHTGQVSPRRIRRPINKLALKKTLQFMAKSAVVDRVWTDVYFPPPGMRKGKAYMWTLSGRTANFYGGSGNIGMGSPVQGQGGIGFAAAPTIQRPNLP